MAERDNTTRSRNVIKTAVAALALVAAGSVASCTQSNADAPDLGDRVFYIPGTDQPLADQSVVFSNGTIDRTDRPVASSSPR